MPEEDLGYKWWIKMKNAPLVINQIALEAAISYPICAQGELRCFHYAVVGGEIKRPFTYLRASLPNIEVIELLIDRHGSLYPSLSGALGPYEIEYNRERQHSLLNLIPVLARKYLHEPAGEDGETFLRVFDLAIPASLRPFYEALNPQFFQWLAKKI
jgi:hypothetical protein